ncbi:MAG: type II secretion system protein [Terriglobia bacterium]
MDHDRMPQIPGFSLLELLIVLAIFGVILGMVFSSFSRGQETGEIAEQEGAMRANLEDILALMEGELRTAGFPPESYFDSEYLRNPGAPRNLVSPGFLSVSSRSMEFEGDINLNGKVDYVRYALGGTAPPFTLNRWGGEVHADGSLPGGSSQKLSEQVEDLEFRYFDRSGNPTGIPQDIASVEIQLTLRTRKRDPISKIFHTLQQVTRIHPPNL